MTVIEGLKIERRRAITLQLHSVIAAVGERKWDTLWRKLINNGEVVAQELAGCKQVNRACHFRQWIFLSLRVF